MIELKDVSFTYESGETENMRMWSVENGAAPRSI